MEHASKPSPGLIVEMRGLRCYNSCESNRGMPALSRLMPPFLPMTRARTYTLFTHIRYRYLSQMWAIAAAGVLLAFDIQSTASTLDGIPTPL